MLVTRACILQSVIGWLQSCNCNQPITFYRNHCDATHWSRYPDLQGRVRVNFLHSLYHSSPSVILASVCTKNIPYIRCTVNRGGGVAGVWELRISPFSFWENMPFKVEKWEFGICWNMRKWLFKPSELKNWDKLLILRILKMLRSDTNAFQTLRIEKSGNIFWELRNQPIFYWELRLVIFLYQISEIEKMDDFPLRIEKTVWKNWELRIDIPPHPQPRS